MRILTAATPWWGHLIESYISAFDELNHNSELFTIMDIKQDSHAIQRALLPYPSYYRFVQNKIRDNLLKKIVEFKPDLLLIFNYPLLYPEVADYCNSKNIKSFLLLGDNPYNNLEIIAQNKYYDNIFCWDPYYVNGMQLLSGREIRYLPHAGDAKIYYPIFPTPNKDIDVCFVGSASFGDNKVFRPNIIINLLNQLMINKTELNILIQGDNSWIPWTKKNEYLKQSFRLGLLSPTEVNKVYNRSKVVLNIHHPQNILSAHMRTFEIALSGSFQIADYKSEISNIFGTSIKTFKDINEATMIINRFLENPISEKNNLQKAREIILSNNTYIHRAQEILNYL